MRLGMMKGTLELGLPSASSMKPLASPRKMRKVSGVGAVHALHELHQRRAHGVALAPALQAGDDVLAGHRLAVMELQALAQLEGPQPLVGALGPALHHLRLDLAVFVGAKEGVVDHVAVVAAHVGGGPDRVQHCEVAVRHHAQHFLLRQRSGRREKRRGRGGQCSQRGNRAAGEFHAVSPSGKSWNQRVRGRSAALSAAGSEGNASRMPDLRLILRAGPGPAHQGKHRRPSR